MQTARGEAGRGARSGEKKQPLQKRALKTRAALLAAVEEIVAAKGPDAVTTTSVAERTGVAVGSIYRYFADREALLLAAYDATVERIAAASVDRLAELDANTSMEEAARLLLHAYLDEAEAIPAHAGLLKAMRSIRTMEEEQNPANVTIIGERIAPFLKKFSPSSRIDKARFHFLNVMIGNLVDLYLVTPGTRAARAAMRREIEAHMLLALQRTMRPRGPRRK
ncbi:TetR/AcrR family transcriptional regulator [Parvibaculum sp.]|jgi:AcrR family transcriptional regulator|uniref:TetR/AcrR family transcriptional regulator n=1 Tax=Parvibaculum sp. TaxID=2024848 RepID=UPI001AFE57BD|nr:TetR/AcrR family transcriptional regulator [Parvibaculum sp.]MBO6668073.1 TetR/AcrR family transcriptional regulator [Parvibaculum sp.]MBO6692029.1 TetR/AcrR family transcriptional regulator [Parvibaculum sp.]MBO6715611.1 TetR/AcrR family transcriptional regulator [Parvibaculum sp.]